MCNKMILCGQGLKKTSICAAFLAMRAGYAIRRINLIWPNLCIIFRMNIGKYGVKFTTVFRLDRDSYGGGILIYVRSGIPYSIKRDFNLREDIEGLFVEINFRKSKWLLLGTYPPPLPLRVKMMFIILAKLDEH